MDGARTATSAARFAEALLALEEELDWGLLGRLHCWEGGEDFFHPAQREAVRDAGLLFAEDIATHLAALDGGAPPRSIYVGAGVAELAPMLCERIVLGREVIAIRLPGPEAAELDRALSAVERQTGTPLFRILSEGWNGLSGEASHGWLVSVLSDPESFPALHDALYGRRDELATGRGVLAEDRRRAEELVGCLLERLRPPCLLTTTDEELELVAQGCARRGWTLSTPHVARLSPVVGDPVRHCWVAPS